MEPRGSLIIITVKVQEHPSPTLRKQTTPFLTTGIHKQHTWSSIELHGNKMQVHHTRGQSSIYTRALNEKVKYLLRIWKGSAGYDGVRVYLFCSHDDHWGGFCQGFMSQLIGPYCGSSKCSSWLTPSVKEWSKVLSTEDGPIVVKNEIPAVHGVVVGIEVVPGRHNNGEVVVDSSSLRFITNVWFCRLLWIDKAKTKDKTYIWVSV